MAISNELSSEIATALLTAKDRSSEELTDLKNILLEVHTTLQDMTERARVERQASAQATKAASSHG
jgi:hypothetical protein